MNNFPCFIFVACCVLFESAPAQALSSPNGASITTSSPAPGTHQQIPPLIVGSEQDYPPFATGMTDSSAGGFTVELWKIVAEEAGLNYTIRVRPFHQLLQEFKDGKIDVLINLAQSDERRTFADFTVPHVVVNGAIFVRKGEHEIRSETDLSKKSIIVLNADLAHDYAVSKGWGNKLVLVNSAAEGFRLLSSGMHDAVMLGKLSGLQTLQQLQIKNIEPLKIKAGFSQKFAFAVSKGQTDLLFQLNEGLAIAKSNQMYDVLYNKWFGPYEDREISFLDFLKYLGPVALIFLGIWAYQLYRRQVERKEALRILQVSKNRLQTIIETEPECIKVVDSRGRLQEMNSAGLAMLEASSLEEAQQKSLIDYVVPECRADFISLHRKVIGGESGKLEFKIIGLRGTPRVLETHAAPMKDESGAMTLLLGVTRDITERKKSDEALQMMRISVDRANDSVFWISREGRILYVNESACKERGYSHEEMLEKFIFDLDPDYHPGIWGPHFDDLKQRGAIRLETRHRTKDGRVYPIEVSANYIHIGGQEFNFCFVRDISERTRIDQMKNQFISTVSHELRTPLTAIIGSLGLIQGGALGEVSPAVRQMVDTSYRNGQRLSRLVNDLLDMEKLMAGKMDFDLLQHKLIPIIEQSIEDNRNYGAGRGVKLSFMGQPSDIEIKVDRHRLQQVLSNLLSNAIKFSPDADTIEIDVHIQNNRVRVSVTDHGPGIADEFRNRIFQKFSQADSSDSRQKGGSGLGLAISREFVERMGGEIGFDSVAGRGASFYVDFPILNV